MTEQTWQTKPETPQEYADRLTQVGLAQHVPTLLAAVLPSVRLRVDGGHPDPEVARTRLGGRPLMPADAAWPATADDRPLSFIAHIDCAEVVPLLPDGPLPADGLLSFFYEGDEQQAWGFDPTQADHWAVSYTPTDTEVALRDFPQALTSYGRYSAGALTCSTEWTFPPVESLTVDALDLPNPWHPYGDVLGDSSHLSDEEYLTHRLLGHPDPVQGDMQLECQLTSQGLYTGDGDYRTTPGFKALAEGADAWRLLLQVDSAENLGMMWGDVGRLYYWMHQDALVAGRWSEAWFVLQCG